MKPGGEPKRQVRSGPSLRMEATTTDAMLAERGWSIDTAELLW
ncbi:hypothetical protein [Streptomyces sp. NBC_00649]